jgi:hypothetical protein
MTKIEVDNLSKYSFSGWTLQSTHRVRVLDRIQLSMPSLCTVFVTVNKTCHVESEETACRAQIWGAVTLLLAPVQWIRCLWLMSGQWRFVSERNMSQSRSGIGAAPNTVPVALNFSTTTEAEITNFLYLQNSKVHHSVYKMSYLDVTSRQSYPIHNHTLFCFLYDPFKYCHVFMAPWLNNNRIFDWIY